MFYIVGWVGVIVLTLAASFAGFFWALKSGQFEEQDRARFFPLIDLPPMTERPRPVRRIPELYALGLGALLAVAALVAAVILSL